MSHLKQYEYVILIAQVGSISQVADMLNMSQPTLSKYIKKLEGDLGLELFDRTTIPLKLTAAGECFVSFGKKLIDTEHQLQKQLEEIKQNKSVTVSLGISPSRAPYLIPSVIELYRNSSNNARIAVKERTTAELSELLKQGELDLVISLLEEKTAEFERIELFEEDILLAVPLSMCGDNEDSLQIMRSSPLIQVGKGLNLCKTMGELTDALQIRSPEIECQSIESALALVKRGIGVTIVPSYVAKYGSEEQNKKIRFLPLPAEASDGANESYKRKVCLFFRKEQFLSNAEKDLISCIKEVTK